MPKLSKPIKRLLIANRGEIANRIASTASELGLEVVTLHTKNDTSHTRCANKSILLPSASSYLDVKQIVSICQKHSIDAVHPGYGFLSESADLAGALSEANIYFIGPSAETLAQTGDKLSARKLAESCDVPVLPGLTTPTDDVESIRAFASQVSYPIMIKAVDGGGGRGIRLVRAEGELSENLQRALGESPSRKVFVEKAAVNGYRHVEVQILGDGAGEVLHFWERECSIQRRYQKVVEIAPSHIDRGLVAKVIECAIRIAKKIKYASLGTFEFLVNPRSIEFYFLEINPRIQVEHTITETLFSGDLVKLQLLLAQGVALADPRIPRSIVEDNSPSLMLPQCHAIQLRLTAEDPRHNFSISPGVISSLVLPSGNGIRVDTHLRTGTKIGTDFDSLLAKIIVSAADFQSAVTKGLRALRELSIEGVTTNRALLAGILLSKDFQRGEADTKWLENNLEGALRQGEDWVKAMDQIQNSLPSSILPKTASTSLSTSSASKSLTPGTTFDVTIRAHDKKAPQKHSITLTKIHRADLPTSLAAEVSLSSSGSTSSTTKASLSITQAVASASPSNLAVLKGQFSSTKLLNPLAGTLVEMFVDEGDAVKQDESVAVIRQMKMELEVRAHRAGIVRNIWQKDDGEQVNAGEVICEIVDSEGKGKL